MLRHAAHQRRLDGGHGSDPSRLHECARQVERGVAPQPGHAIVGGMLGGHHPGRDQAGAARGEAQQIGGAKQQRPLDVVAGAGVRPLVRQDGAELRGRQSIGQRAAHEHGRPPHPGDGRRGQPAVHDQRAG